MPEIVLIVEDDLAQLRSKEQALQQKLHYQTLGTGSKNVIDRLLVAPRERPDIMLIDLDVLGKAGIELIRAVHRVIPDFPVIALIQYGDSAMAGTAVEAGIHDCLPKPVLLEQLKLSLQHAMKIRRMGSYISWLERKIAGHVDFSDMVGESPQFMQALEQASEASANRRPVWIEGEAGTGKELLARAIHGGSDRAGKPFIVVNCAMLPESLAEVALFGQEKVMPHGNPNFILGKLREADQGTLLLKEFIRLSPALQDKVLSMIAADAVTPIDAQAPIPIDVRLICTGKNGADGGNSHDSASQKLLQRFQGSAIALPPLRQRKGDIAMLAEHFLALYAASENKYMQGITGRAFQWLTNYPWPGNIGQLANVIWRALLLCAGPTLDIGDLQMVQKSRPIYFGEVPEGLADLSASVLVDENGQVKPLKSVEKEAIRFALQHAGGCMTRAARSLGIGRSTLYRKVSELEISGYISRANHTTRPMMTVSSTERS